MKRLTLLLFSLLLSSAFLFAGTYSGGSGTSGDPYQIATTDDLIELSNTSGDWGAYFIQTANISFDEDETQVDWNNSGSAGPVEGFSPIGANPEGGGTAFTGSYDGGGYTINNLFIDRPLTSDIGLFGYSDGVTITDIGVTNVDITGKYRVGGLAGSNYSSNVSNSYSTGSVSGNNAHIGGLVGNNNSGSTVSNSYSTGSVSGDDNVGGLVGYNNSGSTVENSYSTGNVNGDYMVGGLVGRNFSSTVSNSYSTGSVSGNTSVGGLVGDNTGGTITDSFWDTTAEPPNNGIGTGLTSAEMQDQSNFTNWDFTNTWSMSSSITFNEYPTLQWTGAYAEEPSQSGGIYQIADLPNLVWIAEDNSRWSNDYEQTADINAWTTPSWDEENGWTPIGNSTTQFNGSYDGGGYTIDNLFIDRSSNEYVGLFGNTSQVTITNIGVTNVDISGNGHVGSLAGYCTISSTVENSHSTGNVAGIGDNVGGLVGRTHNNSTVENSYSMCSVSGSSNNVGGLVGRNNDDSEISNSYSKGSVTGNQYVGGLLGYNNSSSTVENSYSTGSVNGSSYVGGLVGVNYSSTVSNSYSTGKVSGSNVGGLMAYNNNTVSNSFWDTVTSEQSSSAGGTGKTTSEMQTRSTFTDAGWDFDNVWAMSGSYNSGYPNLDGEGSTITWDGSASSSWSNTANWDVNIEPTINDNVVIADAGTPPVVSSGEGIDCNNLTVNSGATLTVNDDGSLITSGSITNNGTINIKRSIPDGEWHLVSSSVDGATANVFLGDYLQSWDESNEIWEEITDETTVLTSAKGYSLWGVAKNTTYTFSGAPHTGSQSISLTSDGSGGNGGFNLVGNPYPSSINWDLLQPTYGTAYIWDASAASGAGDYLEWDASSVGNQNIPPMQGFFVYTASSATLNLANSHRTHNGAANYYKSANAGNGPSNELVLGASNGSYADQFTLRLDEQAAAGFELTKDSWKLLSGGEGVCQIWSESPDGKLAMDTRPYEAVIQLGFQNKQAGVYSIGIEEIADIPTTILEDKKTGEFHNLQTDDYEFTWNPEMDDETRFKLHLSTVGVEDEISNESQDLLIYANKQNIYLKTKENTGVMDVKVMDITGRVVLQNQVNSSGTITIPTDLQTGVYVVEVMQNQKRTTQKVYINQ